MLSPTARSLILDLLSTLRRGSMPVRALVEAGALLGIEENNIRVSLARLHAAGRIERDSRGRYRLGPAVAAISHSLRSWRELGTRRRTWRGDWIAVHRGRLGRGPARRRRERALEWLGFCELEPGLSLRPDNLRGGLAATRDRLEALAAGGDEDSTVGRVFLLRELDRASELEARNLWDAKRLTDDAVHSLAAIRQSEARLPELSAEDAMVETFLVGGAVLRELVRHPLLPDEILDPQPLETLLSAMKRYDRLGRDRWAAFLARHDVPHRALPLDSRSNPLEIAAAPG